MRANIRFDLFYMFNLDGSAQALGLGGLSHVVTRKNSERSKNGGDS